MKVQIINNKILDKIRLGDNTIVGLLAAIFLFLTFATETFFKYDNLYSISYGLSIQFFAVIGFTFLIIMGEIDLAVGSMYGLSGTLVGFCMTVWKWSLFPSMVCVLLVCALFGYLVGYLITRFRLNSMMVTLGTLSLVAGANAVVFNSFPAVIYNLEYRSLAKFKIFDIHWTIIAMLVIVLLLELLLRYSSSVKKVYFIGNGPETAHIYGIKTDSIKRIAFALSSFTAAFGGIIATSRITHSDVLTGNGLEFALITSLVVGGASLAGGRGGMLKSLLGMIFIALLSNGMTIFRIEPFAQQVMLGVVLIIAVFIDSRMNAKKP
jgi:ribose/xylose/arabinose/galactoside ABC-type transport system permease subunit